MLKYPHLARDFSPISKTYIKDMDKNLLIYPESSNDMDDSRRGKDEMNLAVLPIAKLGRSDSRDIIEYHGTFSDKDGQKDMVWIVRGAAGLGLPNELGERVLVALLYIGAQDGFKKHRMEFSVYQVLKILGLADSNRNYRAVEQSIAQIAGILITTDKAWIEKKPDGKQRRITTSRGFHIIDEYYLHNLERGEEGNRSYILWSKRIWQNIQAGYIKQLDIDFYYSLENPLSRRLFRFLDKVTHYQPSKPYVIDIFALSNKLGMVTYEYPAHLRRPLAKAADELVERGWLASYEFFKSGKFNRLRFYRSERIEPVQLTPVKDCDPNVDTSSESELWITILAAFPANLAKHLTGTHLIGIENGTAIIAAGRRVDWIKNRLGERILKELQREMNDITDVSFVE